MGNKSDEKAYLEEIFGISKPKQTSDVEPATAISDQSTKIAPEPTTATSDQSTKVAPEPTTATSDQSTKIAPEPTTATSDPPGSTIIASSPSAIFTAPTSNEMQEAASPSTVNSSLSAPESTYAPTVTTPGSCHNSSHESTSTPPVTTPGSGHYTPPYGTSNKSHVDSLLTMKDSWMLRHCDSYREELESCKSLRGRFHQFYVHGSYLDCSDWKASFDDCKAWNSKADEPAARRIIEREKVRIGRRLKAHYDNDVWEKRQAPPPEWQKPLPEWLREKNEDSYFAAYMAEKVKDANATVSEATLKLYSAKATNMMPSCSIM